MKEEEEAGGLASGEWNDYDEHVLLQIRGRLKEERCGFFYYIFGCFSLRPRFRV